MRAAIQAVVESGEAVEDRINEYGIFFAHSAGCSTQKIILRTYNNKGASYPFIKPTRNDMEIIPFPYDPPDVERVPRATNFADELRKIYVAKNWTIPPEPQAYHIKPIAWGGGNDPSTNGVFLGKTTHSLFTTWWVSYSNLNW